MQRYKKERQLPNGIAAFLCFQGAVFLSHHLFAAHYHYAAIVARHTLTSEVIKVESGRLRVERL
jgi:hypothetical protein